MCAQFYIGDDNDLSGILEEMNRSPLAAAWPKVTGGGLVRPTDVAPVIAMNKKSARAVFPMKWGFAMKSLLINARSETAKEKPAFRDAWAAHRCAVPASWYYEWEHRAAPEGGKAKGEKYAIRPKNGGVTWLGGLYRLEKGLPVFVILTREPGEAIRFIHDRMPLILPGNRVEEWISPDVRPESLLDAALTDMAFVPAKDAAGVF